MGVLESFGGELENVHVDGDVPVDVGWSFIQEAVFFLVARFCIPSTCCHDRSDLILGLMCHLLQHRLLQKPNISKGFPHLAHREPPLELQDWWA